MAVNSAYDSLTCQPPLGHNMPLQLIITDPHNLTEAERMAVLALCQIRVTERDVTKLARDPVHEIIEDARRAVAESRRLGDPIVVDDGKGNTARGEVRIDPLDDPSVGKNHVPPVPSAAAVPAVPSGRALEGDTIDAAAIFGGAATAPSVPIPPAPGPSAVPAVPSAGSVTPAASAPSAGGSSQLPPAAPPNPSNALDVNGMPWDHRIHATTKTKNADQTWRMKRGVDEKLVADVQEQNKRLMAIAPPAIPAAPVAAPPVPGVPPVPATAESTMTFAELMEQVIKLIHGGKVSIEAANAACMPIGITALHQLDKRPDLIPSAWGHIKSAAGVA